MVRLTIQHAFDLALQHHQAGRLHEAEQLYQQILAEQPQHTSAMHYLGLIAHQVGRNDVAVDLMRRAIALGANSAQVFCNFGNVLKAHGQLDEAIAACRQAVALEPRFPEAHNNLANALQERGETDQAIAACHQAIFLRPNFAEAHNNLGNALFDKGQLDEALVAYRRAIALKPDYAQAYNNLGIALNDKGQPDEAVAAFRQALSVDPNYAEAHSNLGNDLKAKGQLDEAIAAFRQAISLSPNFVQAHSNLVFTLQFHPAFDTDAIAEEHRRWDRQHAQPLRKFIQHPPTSSGQDPCNDPIAGHRLRIGYVSPDFRDHVVGRNLLPLFRCHDRRQFEITCYAQVPRHDAMTHEFQQHADRWRNIVGLSDEQVAEGQIREDQIEILVDLALHTANNRLLIFARKPAPVQVTFAGYPGSTGLSAIDYRLSDPYLDPPVADESVYSEKTIRLPDSFWCYDPLDCRETPVNRLPALKTGVVTFGCLSNFCKVNQGVLILWAQVLRQVENSRLLLLAPPGSHRQLTLDHLVKQGIDGNRVEFVPPQSRREYLKAYHRIDVGLDSFPYNGHTTSLDSFWMGVPVVTLVGQRAVSRAGWCQVSNLGLTELAAQTAGQFVRIAVELAKDLARLGELRSTLRPRMEQSALMDASRFARNVEEAYRQMWRTRRETTCSKS